MLSGKILPIHFPPAPDELLSSWYVRLAHANMLKAETFSTVLWGRQHQIWNRDIDRLSPEWLVRILAARTGTSFNVAWSTTLKSYEGTIFTELHPTGISTWILPVQMYHRKHKWPGLQFCPKCLKEDEEPYFRKRWRLALYTACSHHGVLLCNHCPSCGEPVMFHRRELGKTAELDVQPLSLCFRCDYDLRSANAEKPAPYEESAANLAVLTSEWLENAVILLTLDASFYTILHQACKLILSERWENNLLNFISSQVSVKFQILGSAGDMGAPKRAFFEHYSVTERHDILHYAYWILADPAARLNEALKYKALRFNRLYRDLHLLPDWYRKVLFEIKHRESRTFHNLQ